MSENRRLLVVVVLALSLVSAAAAADPTLHAASGTVVKANADVVLVRPRQADGRFGEALALKVRGTTKVSVVSFQKRAGQVVAVQREAQAKDLEPNQVVAVTYANVGEEYVLLTAVAMPPKGK